MEVCLICLLSRSSTVFERMSVRILLRLENHEPCHESLPVVVLAEFGMLVDGEELHLANVLRRSGRWREDIL